MIIMELKYTYWQEEDGWFLGYLDDYPDHWTQGKSLEELEEMLTDLYVIQQEENPEPLPQRKTGTLTIKTA
jgi:predicted RNase H-like HicB family nuclease